MHKTKVGIRISPVAIGALVWDHLPRSSACRLCARERRSHAVIFVFTALRARAVDNAYFPQSDATLSDFRPQSLA